MSKNVVIVGGGIAGLAAAIYLARAGRAVTVFERKQQLGGRAVTHRRHGYRFNLGPHAFFRGGAGAKVYRELGIPILGGVAGRSGVALIGGHECTLPLGWVSLVTTRLLSIREKVDLARALLAIRKGAGRLAGESTLAQWLDANVATERARQVLGALIRLATYCDEANLMSARFALEQMRIAMRGTLYVHEGWQKIVDSLHSAAVTVGVNFVTSSRVVSIEHDGAVRAVHLGELELDAHRMDTQSIGLKLAAPESAGGARLPADTVLLAVDPATASDLVDEPSWRQAKPVTVACFDVALRSLPQPRRSFAIGIDEPLYFSVHSKAAQLAPRGGAMIHVARYLRDGESASPSGSVSAAEVQNQLESMLDRMQPGWHDELVHRRFLPSMKVSNALVTPEVSRPSPVTSIAGLYLAGDWVGDEGLLSDASLASARAAARAILATG